MFILSVFVCFRLEQTKSAILPELLELTNDEETYVRLAGLETVVNVLSLLDDGQYNSSMHLMITLTSCVVNKESCDLREIMKSLGLRSNCFKGPFYLKDRLSDKTSCFKSLNVSRDSTVSVCTAA